jgi:putative ABC transport system substrate-binding protein
LRRREFIGRFGLVGAAVASTLFGRGSSAQSVPKRPLIAWAGAAPPGVKTPQFILDLTFGNLVKELLEFGYEQGRNIDIIRRTDIFRDRVPSIEEMVALVDCQRSSPGRKRNRH